MSEHNHHHNLQKAFSVLQPSPLLSVQGLPRTAIRSFGFPAGGAVVPYCRALANILVGNSPAAPVLEVAQSALLQTHLPLVLACTGDASVEIEGIHFPAGKPLFVPRGSRVRISGKSFSYCAVQGAINILSLQNDASNIPQFGNIQFAKNDEIYIKQTSPPTFSSEINNSVKAPLWRAHAVSPFTLPKNERGEYILRYIPYPISKSSQHQAAKQYTVSTLNRQGIRLTANISEFHAQAVLPSFPVLPGTIQVPPDGNAIILLADAQPTGGYPVLGTVIQTDFSLFSSITQRSKITLQSISLEQARTLFLQEQQLLRVYQKITPLLHKHYEHNRS